MNPIRIAVNTKLQKNKKPNIVTITQSYKTIGQMYEDSIQELNDLIGELDSFQREHELKMKQKEREKHHFKVANSKLTDKTMSTSMNDDTSDIYNNFDKLSISSGEPNPLLCSTQTNSSDITFGSDAADLTASLKLNLSTTEHPLVMQSNFTTISNGTNETNGTNTVKMIQLIPDSYNVSDEYVKENTEFVILRRKGSQNDLNCTTQEPILQNGSISNGSKDIERISSFRCSSFSNGKESTLKREPSITSMDRSNNGHEYINGTSMIIQYDIQSIDQMDNIDNNNDTMQMIRNKPIVTPRPASLSGLFSFFFNLISFYFLLLIKFFYIIYFRSFILIYFHIFFAIFLLMNILIIV